MTGGQRVVGGRVNTGWWADTYVLGGCMSGGRIVEHVGGAQAVWAGRVSLHRGEGGGRGHDHKAGCEYNDLGSKGQC